MDPGGLRLRPAGGLKSGRTDSAQKKPRASMARRRGKEARLGLGGDKLGAPIALNAIRAVLFREGRE